MNASELLHSTWYPEQAHTTLAFTYTRLQLQKELSERVQFVLDL